MKSIITKTFYGILSISIIAAGCDTTRRASNQNKGVVIGAATGAVIGGVIGNNVGKKGNTALGAILGAAIGGAAGGIIGNKMDKQAEKIKTEIPGAQVERVGEGIIVSFPDKNPDGSKMGVYFDFNKATITSNSKIALDKLVKIFNEYPETNILVEGHTDDKGTDSYNLSLSQKRADAVGDYLKNQGIASSRLTIKWYGEAQPKVTNDTEEGRAINRRVEFTILNL